MLTCLRCGDRTPRLTARQVHGPRCEAELAALLAADARRRTARFPAKDFTAVRL